MRTTVTLEADVKKLLEEAMANSRMSFKQTLNEAIRRGFKGSLRASEPSFVVEARPLGLRPGIDPVAVRDLDDEIEIEEFRRKTRALEGRSA